MRCACKASRRTAGRECAPGSGALRHTDGRALLVRGREVGQQSEKRRPRQGGTHRQQRQRQQHLDPRPVGAMQDCQPLELSVAFDERKEDQADAGQEQAQRNQFGFAEYFDQPPDGPALDDRADDAAKDKQGDDRRGGFGFVHGNAKIEIVADQQRQGAFKATERECRQKKNQDQQADVWLRQRVAPLGKMRTPGRPAGIRLQTFGEDAKCEEKIRRAKCGGRPAGSGGAEEMQGDAADRRTENKSQSERHADESHPLRPVFRRRDVGDVGLGDGDVAAADAGEDTGDKQRPERGGVVFKTRPDGEQDIGQRRAGGADEQNGPAAMLVGKPSPNRREDKLHGGERGDDGADDPAARAVMPAEDRHQRHDDAESDEVNEDRQENDEQRWLAVHVQINAVSLATKTGESNLLAATTSKDRGNIQH